MQYCSINSNLIYKTLDLRIESDPSEAAVFILGKKMGITPLAIKQTQLYPAGYDFKYQNQYGCIEVKKEGCETIIYRVRSVDFKKGLIIKLKCKTNFII